MLEVRDLEVDLHINKSYLPDEWEKQPQLYRYWGDEHAYAQMEYDREKEQLELTIADIDIDIRENPEKYGILKVTETQVSMHIKQHPDYQKAINRVHEAKLLVNRMKVAKEAMDHKLDSLKNLSSLAINNFYSANTAPPDTVLTRPMNVMKKQLARTKRKRKLIR